MIEDNAYEPLSFEITPPPIKALDSKMIHDFRTSMASQAIVKEYLSSGHYRRRLNQMRTLHRDRRDYMVSALVRHLLSNATWTIPGGGTFLWIQLPETVALEPLCHAARERKVLVGAGSAFFPKNQGYPALRLNFSLPPEETERGIQVLGEILHDMLKQTRNSPPIKSNIQKRYSQASTYHQLGIVAQALREYEQARAHFQQALDIQVEFGDRYSRAITYSQLGLRGAGTERVRAGEGALPTSARYPSRVWRSLQPSEHLLQRHAKS